jgi:hypothetical protein
MRLRTVRSSILTISIVAASAVLLAQAPASWLGTAVHVAPGVDFYTSLDPSLANPPSPSAVYLLRLDPSKVTLSSAHAKDEIMGLDTVDGIAASHHAIAAVNAGFFNTKTGDPASVLKIAGELVSDTSVAKGVVAIGPESAAPQTFTFDQLSAKEEIRFTAGGKDWVVPVNSVDTTRERDKLTVYTPAYHADTDTAPTGTEIVARGTPLTVREVRPNTGRTPIPRDGIVLSFGGVTLPDALAALKPGTAITLVTNWRSVNHVPASVFESARDVINGAGLLRREGSVITDWKAETLNPLTFLDVRHPRTLIGVDDHGDVWLVAIDGRQPGYASGMDFKELQRLCDRLKLHDALNLDGGGSVTMVVKDKIVNKPSDAAGPRAVSDAILVKPRG